MPRGIQIGSTDIPPGAGLTWTESEVNPSQFSDAFGELSAAIRAIVQDFRSQQIAVPEVELVVKRTVTESKVTETGVFPARSQEQFLHRLTWWGASQKVLQRLKELPVYVLFKEQLADASGKDLSASLEQAATCLIKKALEGSPVDSTRALEFFLKSIQGNPLPAWVDIDVSSISLKTKSIVFTSGRTRLEFRQLDVADFEQEFRASSPIRHDRFMLMANSVLRIEMESRRAWELQLEAAKALAVLRLITVASVDFGQQTFGTESPFTHMSGYGFGATISSGHTRRGSHAVVFEEKSKEKLQQFWERVAPKLPVELYGFGNKTETPLTIAYERYCDSLFPGGPLERKVAACMMGLEALYFRAEEMQELGYRLSLRVLKVLSKLGLNPEVVQRSVKAGYKIRSLHVHGSQVSGKERKEVQRIGISPDQLATELLNYLRTTILHLIISGQSKAEFLDLVELSLVSREKDDALDNLLKKESCVLCLELP